MAKIAFSKLSKIKSSDPVICKIGEEEITVQTYLPIESKLNLIQNVLEQAGNNEEGFCNIVKLETYYTIEMLKAYTNIGFTEKQLSDIPKLYDLVKLNHIWEKIKGFIPEEEYKNIWENLCNLAKELTQYNRSALGILKTVSNDYNSSNIDLNKIAEQIQDPDNFGLIKEIAPLLN